MSEQFVKVTILEKVTEDGDKITTEHILTEEAAESLLRLKGAKKVKISALPEEKPAKKGKKGEEPAEADIV